MSAIFNARTYFFYVSKVSSDNKELCYLSVRQKLENRFRFSARDIDVCERIVFSFYPVNFESVVLEHVDNLGLSVYLNRKRLLKVLEFMAKSLLSKVELEMVARLGTVIPLQSRELDLYKIGNKSLRRVFYEISKKSGTSEELTYEFGSKVMFSWYVTKYYN